MRLVDITMFFAPESGGVKRYLLAKHVWLEGHTWIRPTLLVPGAGDGHDGDAAVTMAGRAIPFSNGYRWPLRPAKWRDRLIALAPAIIEAGDPYRLPWVALEAGQRLGVPVIGFYHSDLVGLIGRRAGRWVEPAVAGYVRRLYREFDLVLAPSQIMADGLSGLGVETVVRQPLGVDTEIFHPCRRDPRLRKELGIPARARLLVFAGRFSQEKNIPILVSAFRRLGSEYHLLLIGAGSMRPASGGNVTVHPYQAGGAELARLLASSDAFVHAGDRETFGVVVLEAMACGIPVVGVRGGAVAELVDHRTGVLVEARSVSDMAAGIAALCEQDVGRLGARARALVERTYSWDRVLRSLVTHYERALGVTGLLRREPAYAAV